MFHVKRYPPLNKPLPSFLEAAGKTQPHPWGKGIGKTITFDVEPVAKPRMTRSDKWNKRPATDRYWAYCDEMKYKANKERFTVPAELTVHFYLPMPESWPERRKQAMEGQPHQSRPDLDNLLKAFKDALCPEDGYVHHYINVRKLWARKGRIEVVLQGD